MIDRGKPATKMLASNRTIARSGKLFGGGRSEIWIWIWIWLRPYKNINLSTTDFCLPSTVWQYSVVSYCRICLFGPNNETEYCVQFFCHCLAVWLCLKMGCENTVLVRLLQIGATDLTVMDMGGQLPGALQDVEIVRRDQLGAVHK